MLEKISDSELDLMECLINPLSAIPCVFSDLNNFLLEDENKFAEIRTAQIPMVSFEYMIDDDPNLNEKDNFQLKVKSGSIECFGGRKYGKCMHEDDWILLSDGRRIKAKDLIDKQEYIFCFNENTWKIEKSLATFADNGKKDCLRITTKSGKQCTVTLNHPLYTEIGWKEAKDLHINDFIATSNNYNIEGKKADKKLAALLGYLIGDGGTTSANVAFTNINQEIIKEYYELADYFDCNVRKGDITYYVRNKKYNRKKNKIRELVLKYNINTLSKLKRIPEEVFTWNDECIAILLNRLFACDGYVSKFNNTISLTSASEGLIKDVQHLLLRFGIIGFIRYKKVKLNYKYFDSWTIIINSYSDCLTFIEKIGIKSKEHIFKKKELLFSNSNCIPNKLYYSIENLLKSFKKKLCTRKFKKYNVSRAKWQNLAKEVSNVEVNKIAFSDIYWDKIVSIEKIESVNTVAVSVPEYNTYISNDIISHNTFIVEKVDIFMTMFWLEGEHIGFSSIDALHIRGVLEEIINTVENHTLFKSFGFRVNRSPNYRISNKAGYLLESINMNILSRNPGQAFFQKHLKRLYLEEASLETEEVFKKRNEAISELGCVIRAAGMTNFTKYSPAGRRFYDLNNKNIVCNLPQYVSPSFDEKEKERATREHGGQSSASYRIFVKGEIFEDGISVFDMARVRPNYLEDKVIKHFEISKDNYNNFRNIIVLDRPKGVDEVYVCADIGESAPTEIAIFFKLKNIFYYHYNITIYNATDKEQYEIFCYIISQLSANVVGIDTTDGTGRAIFRSLNQVVPLSNLVSCSFNEKLSIDFDRDDKGNVIFDKNGAPVYKEEYVSEWSVNRLKDLFYDGRIKCPIDYKLDKQINSVIANQTASRTVYTVASEEDHLFSAFRVFSISVWLKEFANNQAIRSKKFCKTLV